MPWIEVKEMSLKREFVELASQEGANKRELCRRFGISAKTGYKWLNRYSKEGLEGLEARSRKPVHSPKRTSLKMESLIEKMRKAHPSWGARKIWRRLSDLGHENVPAPSTVHEILRRSDCLEEQDPGSSKACKRFERKQPNELWQMDFKGPLTFSEGNGQALSILDDCSRYAVGLTCCENQRTRTVREAMKVTFRRYGLPNAILTDNGSPWGCPGGERFTRLSVEWMRLGIRVLHGRPYHPQTQGKAERFHRTLGVELLKHETFRDRQHCQKRLDGWREVYNTERPHEALGLDTPTTHYHISRRKYPEELPVIEYGEGMQIRKVQNQGWISFQGKVYRLSKAFEGQPVGLASTCQDGIWSVYYCAQEIKRIDERQGVKK